MNHHDRLCIWPGAPYRGCLQALFSLKGERQQAARGRVAPRRPPLHGGEWGLTAENFIESLKNKPHFPPWRGGPAGPGWPSRSDASSCGSLAVDSQLEFLYLHKAKPPEHLRSGGFAYLFELCYSAPVVLSAASSRSSCAATLRSARASSVRTASSGFHFTKARQAIQMPWSTKGIRVYMGHMYFR